MMPTTITFALVLGCVELIIGAPPITINDEKQTTKHWEKEPRDNTTRHWEMEPRDKILSTPHPSGAEVSMEPYGADKDQDSVDGKNRLLTMDSLEGGAGTVPPGAVNDGGVQDSQGISKVPFEISKVPFGGIGGHVPKGPWEGSQGTLPPGAVNDGGAQGISKVPFEISKVPFGGIGGHVPKSPWEGSQGTVPPGAQNEEGSSKIMRGAMFLFRAFGL